MTEPLLSFGEFALALAGFAAIALVLGRRDGSLPAGSAYVVQFMVVNALGPALLAILAAVLLVLGLSEALTFRLCSGLYLAGAGLFAALSLARERDLARAGELVLPRWLGVGLWAGAGAAHAIQLANLVGVPFGTSAGLFLLGLWVLLTVAGVQFVALLFAAFR